MSTTDLLPATFSSGTQLQKCASMRLSDVYGETSAGYLNPFALFTAHYQCIPNCIDEVGLDTKKAAAWFIKEYHSEIRDVYFNKCHHAWSKKAEVEDVYYFVGKDLMVYFDISCGLARFMFRHTPMNEVDALIEKILLFKKRKKNSMPEISLICSGGKGIETRPLRIKKPHFSINDNYNDDFMPIHETISKKLMQKNNKGLVLLHGKPGTGKTSYIRYLITRVKKEVIFLPPNMACSITNPGLISILTQNPNSIFVIEDAENIIVDREQNEASPVSTLLNISDGLLADCLNIQVICSFNTDLSKIDSALMRKGRLIARYEFRELEIQKARALALKLGQQQAIDKPMTLSDIYNRNEMNFEQPKKKSSIGFVFGNKPSEDVISRTA